jgi:predicted negative regulator of RcsB-dependent stress response
MATPQPGQQELKEAIWKYTGQAVLLAGVFLAGGATGWLIWGDAPKLRAQVQELTTTVQSVRAERENANYEISRLKRENERLGRELSACKGSEHPAEAH